MLKLEKPRPIPLIITLVCLATTLALGTWQVQRLQWKEALITKIETANAQAPLLRLPPNNLLDEYHYRYVMLTGEYLHEHELHLAARYYKSQLGYSVLTPFKIADDERTVLVNRGWISAYEKELEKRPDSQPEGEQTITAMIRLNAERNPFTPENQPEKNVWFGRDVAQMAEYTGLELAPLTLDAIGDEVEGLPIPSDGVINLRNDHLSYALTWFMIAAGIAGIFIAYHRKK